MGKILWIIVAVLGSFSLGLWAATILSKLIQKTDPLQLDECKNSLRINTILGWLFLAMSVCAFLPLKFDPIPLRGFSTVVSGFIFLGISGFFLMHRQFRLQALAVMALAREHGKLTKTQVMEHLKVGEERANALIKYLCRTNNILVANEQGTIDKELSEEAKEKRLDRLNENLKKIPGEIEWKLLRELRALRNTFMEKGAWARGINDYSVDEIVSGVEELFSSCVYSLERVYELWSAGEVIQAQATKQEMKRQSDELISDVQKSVEQLGRNLIEIQAARNEGAGEEDTRLATLRDDIKQRIDVARKVRERMEAFEEGFSIKES